MNGKMCLALHRMGGHRCTRCAALANTLLIVADSSPQRRLEEIGGGGPRQCDGRHLTNRSFHPGTHLLWSVSCWASHVALGARSSLQLCQTICLVFVGCVDQVTLNNVRKCSSCSSRHMVRGLPELLQEPRHPTDARRFRYALPELFQRFRILP